MKEIRGELWDFFDHDHVICITTNGYVKNNGDAVMGRGCALEATKKVPKIATYLGMLLKNFGNHVHLLTDKPLPLVISFPVKHNWWEEADLELIARSVAELKEFMDKGWNHKTFVLPRPGCGNGRLTWEQVKPLLLTLPDNVEVITR